MKQILTLIIFLLGPFVLSAQLRTAGTPVLKRAETPPVCLGFDITPVDGNQVTASSLIETILGPGIESYRLIGFQGIATGQLPGEPSQASAGIFSGGDSAGIGIEKGIVLSTGFVANAIGPNISDRVFGILNMPGDPDLTALVNRPTFDATVLEFEFLTYLDEIIIEFVFGSDEYTQFVGGNANDVFAFFLNGQNIAIMPDSGEPISINTINPEINPGFYIDNETYEGDDEWPRYCNEMDGFTTVLTVAAAVNPGVQNTIKLAIADVTDRLIDSWVFIRENGLSGHRPEISIEKKADVRYYHHAGEQVNYSLAVRNTGNISLTDIVVEDELTGESFNLPSLRPGMGHLFMATHTITQGDMDAGKVINLATVAAIDHEGTSLYASDRDTIYLDAGSVNPALTVLKTPDRERYASIGEVITYTLEVSNAGNLTLYSINLEDDLTGDTWSIGQLAPGEGATYMTTYTVLQEDMDRGFVRNQALAAGDDPQGNPVAGSATAVVLVDPDALNPSISIEKAADREYFAAVGDVITYTLVVTNTGNLTITGIVIGDDLTGDDWTIERLAPGESEVFTTSYTIDQADMDRGFVRNTAMASGNDPSDEPVSDTDEAEVVVDPDALNPSLSIDKAADREYFAAVGDVIIYTLVVTNTGNLTITGIVIGDDLTGDAWTIEQLSPGEQGVYSTTYTIGQADMDRGYVRNVASASGQDPSDDTVSDTDEEVVVVDPDALNPAISVIKTADREYYSDIGDEINYMLVVTNAGNLTLYDLVVEDDLTGESWTIGRLSPGEGTVFYTSYTAVQADLDRTYVRNVATATGSDPGGNPVTGADSLDIPADPDAISAQIKLLKRSDKKDYKDVGEVITYKLFLTNAGNLTLFDIELKDDLTGDSWGLALLAPGETVSLTTTHTIVLPDILAGKLTNIATALGTDFNGNEVTDTASLTLTAIPYPELVITIIAITHVETCYGDQDGAVEIEVAGGRPPYSYRWSNGATTQNISQVAGGNYTVVVTDANGVEASAMANIAQPQEISVYNLVIVGVDYIKDPDGSIAFDVSGGTPPYSFLWSTGDTTMHLNNIPGGEYELLITDSLGCEVSFLFFVPYMESECHVKVPGAITPNGDGYNDELFIKCLEYYPNNSLKIITRWGNVIFRASPYNNDWDGIPSVSGYVTDHDGRVPAGTYFYILELEPGAEPLSGYIYLLK